MAKIKLEDIEMTTCGEIPDIGSQAPDFILTDEELKMVRLSDFDNQVVVLISFISADIALFSDNLDLVMKSTAQKKLLRKYLENHDINILGVSMDLPFSIKRTLMDAEKENKRKKPDNLKVLSDFRTGDFGADYGVTIIDGPFAGLLARAIIVLDRSHKVVHTELLTDLLSQPDFKAVRRIVKKL